MRSLLCPHDRKHTASWLSELSGPEPNVPIRVRADIVDVQVEHTGVRLVVPVAAADRDFKSRLNRVSVKTANTPKLSLCSLLLDPAAEQLARLRRQARHDFIALR